MIAEKFVIDHSGQMDTSLLTIPTIAMIVTIAITGIVSGSDPVITSVIITIVNDPNDHVHTQASDCERSERSSYFSMCKFVIKDQL